MASIVDLSQLLRCTSAGSATARTSALVVLDCGCNIATLRLLWERCGAYRVVADGAANGLLGDAHASSEPRRPLLVPDAIAGDCDSIRPEVAAHFQAAHGVPLLVDEGQDCHDMVKCVRAVQAAWRRSGDGHEEHRGALPPALASTSHRALVDGPPSSDASPLMAYSAVGPSSTADSPVTEAAAPPVATAAPQAAGAVAPAAAAAQLAATPAACVAERPRWSLFVYGAFGGRFDHEMANLNALFAHGEDWAACFSQVVLLGEDCAACLLPAGTTRITITAPGEGPKCGLLPIGGCVDSVRSRGLHWNLAGHRCAFGDLVSTSNWVESVYPFSHVCNVDTRAGGGGGGAVAGLAAAAGVASVAASAAGATNVPSATGAGELPPAVAASGTIAATIDGHHVSCSAAASSEPLGDAACSYCSVHADAVEVEASQPIVWTIQLDWRHALSGRGER